MKTIYHQNYIQKQTLTEILRQRIFNGYIEIEKISNDINSQPLKSRF